MEPADVMGVGLERSRALKWTLKPNFELQIQMAR